jgi:glycerophosphoryl diester phosphodiesterase
MNEIVSKRTLAIWALGAGMLPCLLRVGVLSSFGIANHDAIEIGASLLRWPGQSLVALAIGWFFLATGPRHAIGMLLAALWMAVEVAAAHFEAAFGELPTLQAVAQLGASEGASSSILAAAPPLFIGLEWGLCMGALYAGGLWVAHAGVALRLRARFVLTVMAAPALFTAVAPDSLPPRVYWSSQLPLLHLGRAPAVPEPSSEALPASDAIEVLHAMQRDFGHDVPFASGRSTAPLCADQPRKAAGSPTGASIVLLVLEGMGHQELTHRIDSSLVMPALAEIAGQHFSAERFHAAGTQSAQSMPSLYAGLPTQFAQKLLMRNPLPHLQGFPAQLRDAGYRTGYFHGGDLSFEQQRLFLTDIGFDDIVEPQPSDHALSQTGWGLTDGEVFAKLRDWITSQRAGGIPYFASFATISSHHPFVFPENYTPAFGVQDLSHTFASALRYMDEEVGRFYRWFQREEAPRGSWLVIVGDHAPVIINSAAAAKRQAARTDVLFVVVPPPGFDLARLTHASKRLGSHMDVPRTLGALLGQPPLSCDQGLDFFGEDTPARDARIIHSVSARDFNEIYLYTGETRIRLDRRQGKFQLLDEPKRKGDGLSADLARLVSYFERLLPLSYDLLENDRLAPPVARRTAGVPLADSRAPLVVSKGGRHHSNESLADIEQAVKRGFTRVEVDVHLTRDRVTVLLDDAEFKNATGQALGMQQFTLEQLRTRLPELTILTLDEALDRFADAVHFHLHVESQEHTLYDLALAHAIVRSLDARRAKGPMRPVVVDSFNLMLASSIASHCKCEVGWSIPSNQSIIEETVEIASRAGLAWIYAHHSVARAETLSLAHAQGLRLLVVAAERPEDLAPLAGRVPDGILTQSASMLESWR